MLDLGGFLGLELMEASTSPHSQALALNLGRNAWRYLLRSYHPSTVFMPDYICPVMVQTAQQEQCQVTLYSLSADWLPLESLPPNAYILYVNYFGVADRQIQTLAQLYPHLIVDNAQAFYAPPTGMASLYSARKFFGVADGAYLYTDQLLQDTLATDLSYERSQYLLKRLDTGFKNSYTAFQQQEKLLANLPLRRMSKLTTQLLQHINYSTVASKRLANFQILHQHLQSYNQLQLQLEPGAVPMAYPFWLQHPTLGTQLLQQGVHLLRYWPDLESLCSIHSLALNWQQYLLALPVDQRYSPQQMQQLAQLILHLL